MHGPIIINDSCRTMLNQNAFNELFGFRHTYSERGTEIVEQRTIQIERIGTYAIYMLKMNASKCNGQQES